MITFCKRCGKEFEYNPKIKHKVFCSSDCRIRYWSSTHSKKDDFNAVNSNQESILNSLNLKQCDQCKIFYNPRYNSLGCPLCLTIEAHKASLQKLNQELARKHV